MTCMEILSYFPGQVFLVLGGSLSATLRCKWRRSRRSHRELRSSRLASGSTREEATAVATRHVRFNAASSSTAVYPVMECVRQCLWNHCGGGQLATRALIHTNGWRLATGLRIILCSACVSQCHHVSIMPRQFTRLIHHVYRMSTMQRSSRTPFACDMFLLPSGLMISELRNRPSLRKPRIRQINK